MDSDYLDASWNLFESSPHDDGALNHLLHTSARNDQNDGNHDILYDAPFKKSDASSDDNTDATRKRNSSSINKISQAVNFLSLPFEEFNLKEVEHIITKFMGNMALCRIHGKEIRELQGISCLMTLLYNLILKWEDRCQECMDECDVMLCEFKNTKYHEENKIASAILGALRDLSCGDATIRLQIGQYSSSNSIPNIKDDDDEDDGDALYKCRTGIDIICYFLSKYNKYTTWEDIPTEELKTMTNALGVARNITHSTPFNCRKLHEVGMTQVFIHRLVGRIQNVSNSCESIDGVEKLVEPCRKLPSSSKPWREACYRLAGTLINTAEKCQDAAVECAKDEDLIWILIESWGGVKDWDGFFHAAGNLKKAIPVLHLGLFAVLNEKMELERLMKTADRSYVKTDVPTQDSTSGQSSTFQMDGGGEEKALCEHFHLMDVIMCIMENEKRRKLTAQERENARKKHMLRLEGTKI